MGRGRSTTHRFSRARNKVDFVCETALRVAPFAARTGEGKASRMWGRMPITACRAHGRGSSSRNLQHLTRRRSPHARVRDARRHTPRRALAPLAACTGEGHDVANARPDFSFPAPAHTHEAPAGHAHGGAHEPGPAHADEAFSPRGGPPLSPTRLRTRGRGASCARWGSSCSNPAPHPGRGSWPSPSPTGCWTGPGPPGRGSARSIDV